MSAAKILIGVVLVVAVFFVLAAVAKGKPQNQQGGCSGGCGNGAGSVGTLADYTDGGSPSSNLMGV